MTSYDSDYWAIERERLDKEAAGYLCLKGRRSRLINDSMQKRILSVKAEAVAAKLIWDRESTIVSMRDQGVTDAGERFFVLSDQLIMEGPWRNFYIKPGMLQNLIIYLDSNLQATEARAVYAANAEVARQKLKKSLAAAMQQSRQQLERKCAHEKKHCIEPVDRKSDKFPDSQQLNSSERNTKSYPSDGQNKSDSSSPSVIAIFFGFIALVALTVAKVLVEHKHGPQASGFFEPLLIVIFAGVPLFIALRFIFKGGIAESPQRLKSLIIGVLVFLVLAWVIAQLGGGGTFCAYRVGCI